MTGKVKFFNETKGFGFIINDESNTDIFFHISGVENREVLSVDDEVTYDVEETTRGFSAINVTRV